MAKTIKEVELTQDVSLYQISCQSIVFQGSDDLVCV